MYLGIGYFSLSLCLGMILGASNTPVAGTFLTALFGLMGTVIGSQYLHDRSKSLPLSQSSIGVGMMLVSAGIVSGILLGEIYRNSSHAQEKSRLLPWGAMEAPQNTYEALDWIEVQDRLENKGYTPTQIQALYKIRLSEKSALEGIVQDEIERGVEPYDQSRIYDPSQPFNSFVSDTRPPNSSGAQRGLASE